MNGGNIASILTMYAVMARLRAPLHFHRRDKVTKASGGIFDAAAHTKACNDHVIRLGVVIRALVYTMPRRSEDTWLLLMTLLFDALRKS